MPFGTLLDHAGRHPFHYERLERDHLLLNARLLRYGAGTARYRIASQASARRPRTPHVALGWSGVLIIFVALTLPIKDVAASADIMFILLFLQVNLAVLTIRGKYGKNLKYGFLLPFFPILPMIAIGMQFLLVLSLFEISIFAWIYAAIWIGGGFLIYFLYARPRQEKAHRTPVVQQTALMTPTQEAPYRGPRAGRQSGFAGHPAAAGGACGQDERRQGDLAACGHGALAHAPVLRSSLSLRRRCPAREGNLDGG